MRQRRASRAPLTVSVLLFSSRLAATHSFFFFLVQVYVSFFLSHFFFYRTWVDTDTVPCTPLHQIIYCRVFPSTAARTPSVSLFSAREWRTTKEGGEERLSSSCSLPFDLLVFSIFYLAHAPFSHEWITVDGRLFFRSLQLCFSDLLMFLQLN